MIWEYIFFTLYLCFCAGAEERRDDMKLLADRIKKDGKIYPGGVLKVDSFLNHQVDAELLSKAGEEFYRLFGNEGVTKILTAEVSGIAIACLTAPWFGVPMVFAKKNRGSNMSGEVYSQEVMSFTHGKTYDIAVSKEYLKPDDRILIIDDFLARGNALVGLIDLAKQSGAEVVGAGVVIEKAFQGGGDLVRSKGVRVEALATITEMTDDTITLADD